LRALKEQGLVVPEEIPTDDDAIPLDFTLLSNQGVGEIHSRYAVRHSYATFQAALASTKVLHLRRDLRFAQSRFRMLHTGKPKNIVDAMMEDEENISHLLTRITEAEGHAQLVEAVAQSYEDLRNAASREMTRRMGERAAVD
jgi:hypothetical protein